MGKIGQKDPSLSSKSTMGIPPKLSGCSAAWLARFVRDEEAGGSNPPTPNSFKECVLKLFRARVRALTES